MTQTLKTMAAAFVMAGLLFAWPSARLSAAEAVYLADGSNLFWFVQISDLHVGAFLNKDYGPRLSKVLSEGVEVIGPRFVVATGDLTDSTTTDKGLYGFGPIQEEWEEYRGLITKAGVAPEFYFDLPGNHDGYGDGKLSYYREYSLAGSSYDTTQPYWGLQFSHGKYVFIGGADPTNDGLNWPFDNKTYTDEELAEVETHYQFFGASDFSMLFSHHPFDEIKNNEKMLAILKKYDTRHFACGHKHDLHYDFYNDYLMSYRVDSLGKSSDHNVGVYAIDNHSVSLGVSGIDDLWPLVVISAPARAELGGENADGSGNGAFADPYAPSVPKTCANAPVRLLAFDQKGVGSVRFQIDGGGWTAMAKRVNVPDQWRGTFDANGLSAGMHTLTAEATGASVRKTAIRFSVENASCDIGPEDPDEPLDPGEIVVPPITTDGDQEGESDSLAETDSGGETAEADPAAEGEVPADGDGEASACTPLTFRCADKAAREICAMDGQSWQPAEGCLAGTVCQEGDCVPGQADGDEPSESPAVEGEGAPSSDTEKSGEDLDAPGNRNSGGSGVQDPGAGSGGGCQSTNSAAPFALLFGLFFVLWRRLNA